MFCVGQLIRMDIERVKCHNRIIAMWTVIYIHSQGIYDGSAEKDSLSSSCQGLENICTRTYASIHVNLATTRDSFDNFGQNINLHWMVMNVDKHLRAFLRAIDSCMITIIITNGPGVRLLQPCKEYFQTFRNTSESHSYL